MWLLALSGALLVASGCGDDPSPDSADAKLADSAGAADAVAALDTAVDAPILPDNGSITTKTDTLGPYAAQCAQLPPLCDDGNPCTVDGCDPLSGCTSEVKACADEDPCSIDSCDVKTGECQHKNDPCDDGNACTVGACLPEEGCTYSAIDCQDGDACTADGCTPSAGCQHDALNCDDGKTCTADSCDALKGCQHLVADGALCCEIAADCEDGNACTVHKCNAGLCATEAVFGCCKGNGDCDDGNACTVDTCTAITGACTYSPSSAAGCCAGVLDCDDGKACTIDVCQNNTCGHETTCCSTAAGCAGAVSGVELCAEATCSNGACELAALTGDLGKASAGCCVPTVLQSGFESGDSDLPALIPSAFGLWEIAQGFGKSGSGLRFSAKGSGSVPGGNAVAQARFAAVELPVGVESKLTFAYKGTLGSGDVVRLRATTSVGSWWIWQGGNSGSNWVTAVVDLSGFGSRAATRNLKLSLEILGGKGSSAGWTVDDWQISSTCKPRSCSQASQCNDNLGATADSCSAGRCVYATSKDYCIPGEPSALCGDDNACTNDYCSGFGCGHTKKAGCCLQTSECDDKDLCTTDACSNNLCLHDKLPGSQCCNKAGDCDDGKVCTLDSCPEVGLACAHTMVDAACCDSAKDCDDGSACTIDSCSKNACLHKNTCCSSDADCADSDPVCTEDKCVAGQCVWTAVKKPECCEPQVLQADFEAGLPKTWMTSATSKSVQWQVVSGKKSKSGTGALYYGNPATGNYDDGSSNSGTVGLVAPISVAAGESLVLSFWLYMDTEAGSYDTLDLEVVGNGKAPVAVWQKETVPGGALSMKAWTLFSVDLSAFGGQSITVQFNFDTQDSVANTMEGVYIDDLSIVRGCAAKICSTAADCSDNWSGSTDLCSGGGCKWSIP
jgi:hypothetical protein